MYSIIGILIVAFGFFAPYLSEGMIGATLFFWIGFLLFLSPGRKKSSLGDWMRWAKVGLVTNIVGGIISIIYGQLLLNSFLAKNFLIANLFMALMWLTTSITQMLALVFPDYQLNQATNSEIVVQYYIGFSGARVTSLLDIIVFMLIAIVLGRHFSKRRRYLY